MKEATGWENLKQTVACVPNLDHLAGASHGAMLSRGSAVSCPICDAGFRAHAAVVLKQFRAVAPISLDILLFQLGPIVLRELERFQAWPHATA
jgi:hypothetical protein